MGEAKGSGGWEEGDRRTWRTENARSTLMMMRINDFT